MNQIVCSSFEFCYHIVFSFSLQSNARGKSLQNTLQNCMILKIAKIFERFFRNFPRMFKESCNESFPRCFGSQRLLRSQRFFKIFESFKDCSRFCMIFEDLKSYEMLNFDFGSFVDFTNFKIFEQYFAISKILSRFFRF